MNIKILGTHWVAKIGKLKFNDINDLINSIKGNAINEADAKKK